jgi:ferric-dicitrate binding protein FerR (iron transport regulator)
VARDTARPFTVEAGAVDVTVLGTAFEVTAFDTAATVLVRVREGRVHVTAGPDTALLQAGDQVRYDRTRHLLERGRNGPLEQWGDRVLQFDQAPMDLVVERLQQRYGLELELANAAIARCRLTATFEDEPVDTVLQVIADTFGLRVVHTGPDRYRFEGDGC